MAKALISSSLSSLIPLLPRAAGGACATRPLLLWLSRSRRASAVNGIADDYNHASIRLQIPNPNHGSHSQLAQCLPHLTIAKVQSSHKWAWLSSRKFLRPLDLRGYSASCSSSWCSPEFFLPKLASCSFIGPFDSSADLVFVSLNGERSTLKYKGRFHGFLKSVVVLSQNKKKR